MSRRRHKKKFTENEYIEVELNIMPFIDVFSILTTFLLMTAVFLSIGIHEVQVPFFTSVKPEKTDPNQRTLSVKVEVEKTKVLLESYWSSPSQSKISVEVAKEFEMTEAGLQNLHNELVKLKVKEPKTDLVSLYSEDDVIFEQLNSVLDAIKVRQKEDPEIPSDAPTATESSAADPSAGSILFSKIVFSSVVL